ncbi:mechanosensitive ion channel family protein [Candidatus Reidiella endopervernicosa]|uniref:Small-conductance mechanosensitive channel n=1 Tax=Candidatus Reidiella endopervernicosa TaxID=2738883 RepID=A0A6N0HXU7_9GAMM|nr:mechanosensitive ion channel domain-containing protein [Candidatus Reidiella endopervernicosa]QKQ27180.1 mechanosensitive ion channel [Candidatus Reidiella endopervernicosa]
MIEMNQESMGQFVDLYAIPWGIKLVTALVIFIIGRWIAKSVVSMMRRLMGRSKMDDILINFLGSITYAVLMVAVVIAALDQLGVNTTSLLAIMGAAGLAVGLALKDSLSNFAAGVMIIIFRPFKMGDFVEVAGVSGVVEEVRIFSTQLKTGDNREIIVPNSNIYGGTIVNVSARPTRRIDMVFGIGYDDDMRKARDIMEKIMAADERILAEPAAAVSVAELADSSVNFNVRPWVKSGDYWAVRSDLLEQIKIAFDENGISIPYPQTDIHVVEQSAA